MDDNGIWSRYKEIMLLPQSELDYNSDNQLLNVLFEDEWIRILLIRFRDEDEESIIEVELSLPNETSDVMQTLTPKQLLVSTIGKLKFIQKLCENGFKLQLVDRDWLWSASMEMSDQQIHQRFFENLIPP